MLNLCTIFHHFFPPCSVFKQCTMCLRLGLELPAWPTSGHWHSLAKWREQGFQPLHIWAPWCLVMNLVIHWILWSIWWQCWWHILWGTKFVTIFGENFITIFGDSLKLSPYFVTFLAQHFSVNQRYQICHNFRFLIKIVDVFPFDRPVCLLSCLPQLKQQFHSNLTFHKFDG